MKCSDCGLDSCVLKEIELTGRLCLSTVSSVTSSTSFLSAEPQTQPGHVARPARHHSHLALCASTARTQKHLKCMLWAPSCCIKNPSFHTLWRLEKSYRLFCFATFSNLCWLQVWFHFSAIKMPLLSCTLLIILYTWKLTSAFAASTDILACSFIVLSHPAPMCLFSAYSSLFSMPALLHLFPPLLL